MCERDMFSNIGVHTMEPEVFMFLRCLFGFKFTPDRFLIGHGAGAQHCKGAVAFASPLVLGASGLPVHRQAKLFRAMMTGCLLPVNPH